MPIFILRFTPTFPNFHLPELFSLLKATQKPYRIISHNFPLILVKCTTSQIDHLLQRSIFLKSASYLYSQVNNTLILNSFDTKNVTEIKYRIDIVSIDLFIPKEVRRGLIESEIRPGMVVDLNRPGVIYQIFVLKRSGFYNEYNFCDCNILTETCKGGFECVNKKYLYSGNGKQQTNNFVINDATNNDVTNENNNFVINENNNFVINENNNFVINENNNLVNNDVTNSFIINENNNCENNTGINNTIIYKGIFYKNSQRKHFLNFSTKKRPFVGITAMDWELSIFMANLIDTPLVYHPFQNETRIVKNESINAPLVNKDLNDENIKIKYCLNKECFACSRNELNKKLIEEFNGIMEKEENDKQNIKKIAKKNLNIEINPETFDSKSDLEKNIEKNANLEQKFNENDFRNEPQNKKPKIILDPFAGSGGILMACSLFNHHVMGIDYDKKMMIGTNELKNNVKTNLKGYNITDNFRFLNRTQNVLGFFIGDAFKMKLNAEFDAIVTDPPYGDRISLNKMEVLGYIKGLKEICDRNLKKGGKVCFFMVKEDVEIVDDVFCGYRRVFCVEQRLATVVRVLFLYYKL